MDYLKLFETHQGYDDFVSGGTMEKPNVSHCIEENEVHYNPLPITNGHAYVDLGLPSGTLWATMNVGANIETDYGLYFQWGDTQGYTASQVGTGDGQKAFSSSDYKYHGSGDFSKYNYSDELTQLELTDDAARANWGGDWHIPTKEQCEELCNSTYVDKKWVLNYNDSGVNGGLFTSLSNGNTLFIPAAGRLLDGSVKSVYEYCYVLTSTLYSKGSSNIWDLICHSGGQWPNGGSYRYWGQSVRGVVG